MLTRLIRYFFIVIIAATGGCQSTFYEQDLTLVSASSLLPDLEEVYKNKSDDLLRSIDQSLVWFDTSTSKSSYAKHDSFSTHENAKQSLITFRKLLLQSSDAREFARSIVSQFNIYQSAGNDGKGTVLFTGYFAPEYLASRTQTEKFKYPLYSLPEDFSRNRDSRLPNRYEIKANNLLAGHEIAWLEDPLSVYLIQVNGSAKLRLPNSAPMYVSYTTTNKYKYTSLGKLLIDAGLSSSDEMSMQKIREIYDQTPEIVEELMLENDRFVFFKESSDENWPCGSIGAALTPEASLAMDHSVFPPSGLFLVDTQIDNASDTQSQYVRVMLNQDTGGAIRGTGRADIYMGVGQQAGEIAGSLKSKGKLFYILLNRN